MLNNCTYKFNTKHIILYEPGQSEETCISDAIKAHNGRNVSAGHRTGRIASNATVSTVLFVKDKYESLLDLLIGAEIQFATRSTYHIYTEKYIRKAVTVTFDRMTNNFICTVVSRPLGFSFGTKDGKCDHYDGLTVGARHPTRTATVALFSGPKQC